MRDYVHICISIPMKYSAFHIVGYMKGKCAIAIARPFKGKQRNFSGEYFRIRGYFDAQ